MGDCVSLHTVFLICFWWQAELLFFFIDPDRFFMVWFPRRCDSKRNHFLKFRLSRCFCRWRRRRPWVDRYPTRLLTTSESWKSQLTFSMYYTSVIDFKTLESWNILSGCVFCHFCCWGRRYFLLSIPTDFFTILSPWNCGKFSRAARIQVPKFVCFVSSLCCSLCLVFVPYQKKKTNCLNLPNFHPLQLFYVHGCCCCSSDPTDPFQNFGASKFALELTKFSELLFFNLWSSERAGRAANENT